MEAVKSRNQGKGAGVDAGRFVSRLRRRRGDGGGAPAVAGHGVEGAGHVELMGRKSLYGKF